MRWLALSSTLLFAACSPTYAPYLRAGQPEFSGQPCVPGQHGLGERITAYGRTLVAVCGDREALFHEGLMLDSPLEFWVGDGPAWAPSGRVAVRYGLLGTSPSDPPVRLDLDVVLTSDEGLKEHVLGLIPSSAPRTGSPYEATLDVHLGRAEPTAATAWAKDPAEFYGRLGPPLAHYDDRMFDMNRKATWVSKEPVSLDHFDLATCGAVRYIALQDRSDPYKSLLAWWWTQLSDDVEPAALATLKERLKDPITRCEAETFAEVKAAMERRARRIQDFEKEEVVRRAERDATVAREAKEREARLDAVRALAEQLALKGQPFTALAILGWLRAERSRPLEVYAVPPTDVALRSGLTESELDEALRSLLFRKYWTSLSWSAGGQSFQDTWPAKSDRAPVHAAAAVATVPAVTPTETKSVSERSTWVDGETVVDQQALSRAQASLKSASASARPLLERLEAIDGRLARIEERLQGPKLEVGATKGSSTSRMQQVCEPVPGGPPRCVNKWTTFTADGPMKSNGGLSPFEADDLKEERTKLRDERADLVRRLEGLGEVAKAASGPTPTKKMRQLRTTRSDVYTYTAEADVTVTTTRDGKSWERHPAHVSMSLESRNWPLTAEAQRKELELQAMYAAANVLLERWKATHEAQLVKDVQTIPSAAERERELSLARLYFGTTRSQDFLDGSRSVIAPLVSSAAATGR